MNNGPSNNTQQNQEAPIYANIKLEDASIQVPPNVQQNEHDLQSYQEVGQVYNLNFFFDHPNIYKINRLRPVDKYVASHYVKITCPNITTEIIDNIPYSYLTNPQTIESKFYFATRDNQTLEFKPKFQWRSGIFHSVSYADLTNFLKDLNIISPTKIAFQEYITSYEQKRKIWMIISIILLIISVGLFIAVPFVFWPARIGLSVAASTMFLIFFILMCMASYSISRKRSFDVNRMYIYHDPTIEDSVIQRWNVEFFIPRGVYVTHPRNFAYLQFNVDRSWKLELEDHHASNN